MGLKHNCVREGDFEFISVDITGQEPDKIQCKVCGRIWVEENEN